MTTLVRRVVFWVVFGALLLLMIVFSIRAPQGHLALEVWVSVAVLVLLLWCVVYVGKEITLVRLALILIAVVFATIVFEYMKRRSGW